MGLGLMLTMIAGMAPAKADEAVPLLTWGACPPAAAGAASTAAFECAEAEVPMDYATPEAGRFTLAVIKHPARRPAERIGTLFWNPGGPSDAGTEYLPASIHGFPEEVRDRFDIISWDPRGMGGRSRPVIQCFDSAAAEAAFAETHFGSGIATTPEALAHEFEVRAAFNAACIARGGELLKHVSTADNARDLDLLRRALGEERISYYGTSYGTFLGATYINMFPSHVRATVLDGGVAPSAWMGNAGEDPALSTFVRLGSDFGAVATVDAFMRACGEASAKDCAFSAGSPAATRQKWAALLERARTGGIVHEGEAASDGAIVSYVMSSVYLVDPLPGFDRFPGYRAVAELLQALWTSDAKAAPAPDAEPGTQPAPSAAAAAETYVTSGGRQLAVICGESPNPESLAANVAQVEASFRRAGLSPWPFGAACRGWTARASAPYAGPWNVPLDKPVLVIANSFDPATAFGSSVRLAQELADARLLPVLGFGHTVLLNPNRCAQDVVSRYLVDLALPPTGTACREDRSPFSGG
ncbi:alpha/beta hydrolase [Aestuariivirga litoralis]|uniref:Alpha/beta hydrolase n=2 Tax=Aestuariivirga litoralis TaxID=2650924 RepID=A0A2W2B6E0_9HYPH|nr:alpha/beta hydrolase [Aestuariivirga litoralis]